MTDKDFPLTSQRSKEFSKWEGCKNLEQVAGGKACLLHLEAWECQRFGLFIIHPVQSHKLYFLPSGFYFIALKAGGSVSGIGLKKNVRKTQAAAFQDHPPLSSPSLLRPRRSCTRLQGCSQRGWGSEEP